MANVEFQSPDANERFFKVVNIIIISWRHYFLSETRWRHQWRRSTFDFIWNWHKPKWTSGTWWVPPIDVCGQIRSNYKFKIFAISRRKCLWKSYGTQWRWNLNSKMFFSQHFWSEYKRFYELSFLHVFMIWNVAKNSPLLYWCTLMFVLKV